MKEKYRFYFIFIFIKKIEIKEETREMTYATPSTTQPCMDRIAESYLGSQSRLQMEMTVKTVITRMDVIVLIRYGCHHKYHGNLVLFHIYLYCSFLK